MLKIRIADPFEGQPVWPLPPVDPPEPLDEGIDRCRFGEAHIVIDTGGGLRWPACRREGAARGGSTQPDLQMIVPKRLFRLVALADRYR